MKIIYLILILFAITFHPAIANDRVEIKKLISKYGQAINASDTQAMISLFTKDGVFIPANLPTAIGLNEIEKAYDHEFKALDLEIEPVIDEISIGSSIAFVRTRSSGHLVLLASNTKKSTTSYRALFIFKKKQGTWKIARLIFNFSK